MVDTQASPESSDASRAGPTDTDGNALGSSSETPAAHPQTQSAFFSALPLEIRQNIYQHLWEAAGSTQHVYKASSSALAPLSHCACISDPDAEDVREVELNRVLAAPPADQTLVDGVLSQEAVAQNDEIDDWRLRNMSLWCNHWRCEEEPPVLRPLHYDIGDSVGDKKKKKKHRQLLVKEFSPFLAILLACKRMHQEAVDSIYDDTTFSFIGTDPLSRFLETTAAESLARINTLHLIWSAPVETYMDLQHEDAVAARTKWNQVWTDVALKLPRLKELRMWHYPQYARYPMPHEEWYRPLHQLRHVPKFNISLRWFVDPAAPDMGPLDFMDEAPFEYGQTPPLQENPLHFYWRRLVGLNVDERRSVPSRRQRSRRYLGRS